MLNPNGRTCTFDNCGIAYCDTVLIILETSWALGQSELQTNPFEYFKAHPCDIGDNLGVRA